MSTGFRLTKDGGSEIVIQTSAEVTLEERSTDGASVFVVKNCRVQRNNDRRPLDTRFFDSPVTGVTLKEHGGDLEISVALAVPPEETTSRAPSDRVVLAAVPPEYTAAVPPLKTFVLLAVPPEMLSWPAAICVPVASPPV